MRLRIITSSTSIFDIISNATLYPSKTEYVAYSGDLTNGAVTLGSQSMLNVGDYGIITIKKYDSYRISIYVASNSENGKLLSSVCNKDSISLKFVYIMSGATQAVQTIRIDKAT